jgi:quercetin dioxygenase-like cupin family protein
MKNSILMMLAMVAFMTLVDVQTVNAQQKMEPWPGVTKKVLTDNDKVNVAEVTFAPGAVADWHSHPAYSVYAVTDVKMKTEFKDKESVIVEMKAGQVGWSEAVTHKTSNVGKKPFTVIVTEIK